MRLAVCLPASEVVNSGRGEAVEENREQREIRDGWTMRFCMVTTFYPPYHFGGDGIFVRALARALVSQGHHVDVVHCEDAYRLRCRQQPANQAGHDGVVVGAGSNNRARAQNDFAT